MSTFQSLSPEILLLVTSFLDVKTLLQLSCTSKAYSHLITDEQVYRGLVDRAFRVNYKNEAKTWRELYKQLSAHQLDICPHLSLIADDESETKRIVFRALRPTVCDVCSLQPAVYLSMSPDYHTQGNTPP
jgi:hypothetical protein